MKREINVFTANEMGAIVRQLERLDTLLEYLETQNAITEDDPAFNEMCEFYVEFEQVLQNLHNLIG